MDKQSIATSESPTIVLELDGNLHLKGWDEMEVLARCASPDELTLEHQDDRVTIRCRSDCTVRVPYAASLQVNYIHGKATLKSLDGNLLIRNVSGHLTLRSVGVSEVQTVGGHLTAKNISGDLRVDTVDGHATVRDVQGDFIVQNAIHGSLTLKDLDGDASARVHGNVALHLDPTPGNTYNFEAGGNLVCHLPTDASVKIQVPSASKISVNLLVVQTPASAKTPYELVLGDGDATLTLSAGGNVILGSQPREWGVEDLEVDVGEDLGDLAETISLHVTQQVEAQLEMLQQQLDTQLSNLSTMFGEVDISPEKAEKIAEWVRTASERTTARAQEKIKRAQEKLQRKLETARHRAERKARLVEQAARDRRRRVVPFGWTSPSQPVPTQEEPVSEPVTDDERLMILQMVEHHKITIEEAEKLLEALEGKS